MLSPAEFETDASTRNPAPGLATGRKTPMGRENHCHHTLISVFARLHRVITATPAECVAEVIASFSTEENLPRKQPSEQRVFSVKKANTQSMATMH